MSTIYADELPNLTPTDSPGSIIMVQVKGLAERRASGFCGGWAWIAFDNNGAELGREKRQEAPRPNANEHTLTCRAIVQALFWAKQLGLRNLAILTDTGQSIPRYMAGLSIPADPKLQELSERARSLASEVGAVCVWVPHTNIKDAGDLAREALALALEERLAA